MDDIAKTSWETFEKFLWEHLSDAETRALSAAHQLFWILTLKGGVPPGILLENYFLIGPWFTPRKVSRCSQIHPAGKKHGIQLTSKAPSATEGVEAC